MNAAFWDDTYRSRAQVWSGDPNPHVVSEVSGLAPGRALDAGSGEGDDAVWLAQHGWSVTAVDISAVAVERSAARAATLDPAVAQRIEWLRADVAEWTPPRSYDLVSAQFLQLPPEPRAQIFRRLARAVTPGGVLLIVGHHPSDLQTSVRRPPLPEVLYTPDEITALLEPAAWDIAVSAARERSAVDREGRTVPVHDSVVLARRRTP